MPPMNTAPDQFAQDQPKLKPLSEALTSVFKEIESEDTKRETPTTFFENGREKKVASNLEQAMADIQASVKIAQEVLDVAIQSGDYRQEQVAAKAFAAMKAGVDFATFYAETFSQSPEAAKTLQNLLTRFFETTNLEKGEGSANDKYLLAA